MQELVDAINRRRRLSYQIEQDFSTVAGSGKNIRKAAIDGTIFPPFDSLRTNLASKVLYPPPFVLIGSPRSPESMQWLWPFNDGDENKVMVSTTPAAGQVNIFQKLNQTSSWTDPVLTANSSHVRAVHWNELRQVATWLQRGRWTMPIYFTVGLFSMMPDTSWFGDGIANNGTDELRCVGFSKIISDVNPTHGLMDVTVRSTSAIQITADSDCSAELYRILRPFDLANNPPTWNQYNPGTSSNWTTPGGLGADDAIYIGSLNLSAGVAATISNQAVADALQAMVDGAPPNFLICRTDTDYSMIGISGKLVIEFDLNSPPN